MISLASGLRVYLACGVTDMRNYAEHTIMRSPRDPGLFLRELAKPDGAGGLHNYTSPRSL
jgi:hypothetical protein